MTPALDDDAQRFLDLAATGRAGPAIEHALTHTGAALTTERFITDVLCPVQAHVGARWQANQWSEADEHAVTSVVEEVVGALSRRADGAVPSRGRVLVACVEGEQHSLPARLGAERLRLQGWAVTFLGGSLPRRAIVDFAARTKPDIVVLSCTRALCLPAARRAIGALAELGVPVVAAGAGFGRTRRCSERLGASGWIGPTSDPSAVLEGPLVPARTGTDAEMAAELEWHIEDLAVGSLAELYVRTPALASRDIACIALLTDDLRDVLRYVAASLEVDDRRVLSDYLTWLTGTLTSHQAQPDVLDAALDVTATVAERIGFGQVTAALRRGRLRRVATP